MYFKLSKFILFALQFFLLVGCASSKSINFRVTSEPSNAQVDVNGMDVGNTPTEISLSCAQRWVGLAYSESVGFIYFQI